MLPKNLNYIGKVESANARSMRLNIAPQNGLSGYGLNSTININIPCSQNTVLVPQESYLKFDLSFTSGGAANVVRLPECGTHGIIQRVRVWAGSNLLEDIDSYGLLAKIMMDLQVATDSSQGKYNILAGTNGSLVVNAPSLVTGTNVDLTSAATAVATLTTIFANQNIANTINQGDSLGTLGNNAVVTNTYCLNLFSVMGYLCSQRYFPLFACSSSGIRLEIQLCSQINQCICSTQGGTISLNNVEYVADIIELSDAAMSIIRGSQGDQPLQMVMPQWRNYQYTYGALAQNTTTLISIPVPCKFKSVKSIICAIRDQYNTLTFQPFSSVVAGCNQVYFRVGSQTYPNKPISTTVVGSMAEFFAESVKALGSMSDVNFQPNINKASFSQQFSVANSTAYGTGSGSFILGLDLENFAGSDKSQIFSGFDTSTTDTFIYAQFTPTANVAGLRFDAYSLIDALFVFENGVCYTKV